MINQFKDIARRILGLEQDVGRLKAQQFSRIVPVTQPVIVLNDVSNRNTTYTVNVQVTGTGGLPTNITGIWYTIFVSSASAANAMVLTIDNPDNFSGFFNIATKFVAINDKATFTGFCRLGAASGANAGQLKLTVQQGTNPVVNQLQISVWAYLV